MNALLLVDLQYDFMLGGALAVPEGAQVVPLINDLQAAFSVVVATQDWHPAGHVSFASSHAGKKPFEEITLQGKPQTLWPDHCVQGSKGAAFHADLLDTQIDAIIRKGSDPQVDSYSAFYDNDHLRSTGLAGYLRERKVDTLYFCGLAADICVYYSIKDALAEGFSCVLIEDATRALDQERFLQLQQELQALGMRSVTSNELHAEFSLAQRYGS